MSVIYDALKKLKKSEEGKRQQTPLESTPNANVIIFDDLLKKHAVTTYTILGLMTLAIGGLLYFLNQYEVVSPPPALQQITTPQPSMNPEGTSDTEKNQDEPDLVVAHIKLAPATDASVAPEVEEDASEILFTQDTTTPPVSPQVDQVTFSPAQSPHTNEEAGGGDVANDVEVASDAVYRPEGNASKRPFTPEMNSSEPQQHMRAPIHQVAAVPKPKTKPSQATDFSPVIHTLNDELQRSILLGDFETGAEIITELEQLLGADSDYILNLKAYFYIQSNDLEKAHAILAEVLDVNERELDAGLNMIVVLCRQGELQLARLQIEQLLEYYPANPILIQFKQQLGN
jgi:hypothetical protein